MIELNVQGMTCGGCARAVTNAVQRVDPSASVNVDLSSRRVAVESAADPSTLKTAIEEAGYQVSL